MSDRVLVTGISGFIAKHVALKLLQEGYAVRGTVRDSARTDEVRLALERNGADVSRLEFVEADLDADAGWGAATEGCTYVMHVASPFPITQPRDREALVPQARDGALRVLEAARKSDVARVVVTSSMVAMMYRPGRPPEVKVRENDWTDVEWNELSAYIVSKTRAERAVWDWAKSNEWEDRLVVINPGLVLGPALDRRTGTSLDVIKLMMEGKYPAAPPVSFAVVDVRDQADLHVAALTAPGVVGRRLIGAAGTLSLPEVGRILREAFPAYAKKIPKATLPAFAVRLLSNFDRSLKSLTADLGVVPVADNGYVTELTRVEMRSASEALRAAGQSLVDFSLV